MYQVQKSTPEIFYSYALIHLADITWVPTIGRHWAHTEAHEVGRIWGIIWSTIPKHDPLDNSDESSLDLSLKIFCDGKLTILQGSLCPFQNDDC